MISIPLSDKTPPGSPGRPAKWANAQKDGIGTAVAQTSHVWFSAASGILTETFYPAPDQACTRCLELIVTNGTDFVSEEARDAAHEVTSGDTPTYHVRNTCKRGRYYIDKQIVADPHADVILQQIGFKSLALEHDRLFCVLEPHLGNSGDGNTARIGMHKGVYVLSAARADGLALVLACSSPFIAATAGFIGDDGRAQLAAHKKLIEQFAEAKNGNVSLTAEIDCTRDEGVLTLALAFARTSEEAAHLAVSALQRGFDRARFDYDAEWKAWSETLTEPRVDGVQPRLWQRSTHTLKTLEAKTGGRVAALSTPWGEMRGPGIAGPAQGIGPRDLVESVGALLAAGGKHEARHALQYLRATQEADGHWPQNMRLSGTPVWNNNELDEVALPVVFLHLLERDGMLARGELRQLWPMVRNAAGFLARNGPSTPRDRWEDATGVTPFTVSAIIVALLIAADLAPESHTADVLRALADLWHDGLDGWLYRRGGALAEKVGVDGYYVRARKPGEPFAEKLDLEKLPPHEVSPDALALVRFGLRVADDPRIMNTVRVIDATLRDELPAGPSWRRYPGDAYGEHADGRAFDGHGIGRPWPLLTGERAHYELARGEVGTARKLMKTMETFANASGYLPEQVWNAPDIAERGLLRGRPSGSAAPLGWAHGEYVKLARSLADGRVFDLPRHAVERYAHGVAHARTTLWRVGDPLAPVRGNLRIACLAPAIVEWRKADAAPVKEATRDSALGLHTADIVNDGRDIRAIIRHLDPQAHDGRELVFQMEKS